MFSGRYNITQDKDPFAYKKARNFVSKTSQGRLLKIGSLVGDQVGESSSMIYEGGTYHLRVNSSVIMMEDHAGNHVEFDIRNEDRQHLIWAKEALEKEIGVELK
jgi:hypothetical protein